MIDFVNDWLIVWHHWRWVSNLFPRFCGDFAMWGTSRHISNLLFGLNLNYPSSLSATKKWGNCGTFRKIETVTDWLTNWVRSLIHDLWLTDKLGQVTGLVWSLISDKLGQVIESWSLIGWQTGSGHWVGVVWFLTNWVRSLSHGL